MEQQLAAPGLNHAGVTPFEKNVEVWKQLWRVIERSDVVVQIVDARDPLMFRCQDLEAYVAEVNPAKRCLLIINKADFLPLHLREAWASYLEGEGIDFLFFSAKAEADRLEAEAKALETYLDAGALEQHELLGGGGDSSASTGASSAGADDGASDSGDSGAPATATATAVAAPPGPMAGTGVGGAVAPPTVPEAPAQEEGEGESSRTRVLGRLELTEYLEETYAHLLHVNTAGKQSTRKQAQLEAALAAEKEAAAAEAARAAAAAEAAAAEAAASAARAAAGGEEAAVEGVFSDPTGHGDVAYDDDGAEEGDGPSVAGEVELAEAELPLGAEAATMVGAVLGGNAKGRRKFGARGGQGKAARTQFAGGAIDIGEEHVTWVNGVPTVDMARAAKTIAESLKGGAAGAHLSKLMGKAEAGEEEGGEAAPRRRRLTIGMVGYPNVGKSSLINVLLGVTSSNHHGLRVAVSSTPGKTRHFQTLELTDKVTLCDCPGLVFPSFVATRAEMVCNGMLPLAHLRDHVPPMWLLVSRVPRRQIQERYGITIPPPGPEENPHRIPTVKEVLDAFCTERGLMASAHAGPNHPAGARILLRDYVEGRLVYCHPPPGFDGGPAAAVSSEDTAAAQSASRLAGASDHDVLTAIRSGQPAGAHTVAAAGLGGLRMTMPKPRVGASAPEALPMQPSSGAHAGPNVLRAAGDGAGVGQEQGAFEDTFFAEPAEPVAAPPKRAPRIKGRGKNSRIRKGARDADPYGTQLEGADAAAAFMSSLVQGETAKPTSKKQARRAALASKAAHRGAQPAGGR